MSARNNKIKPKGDYLLSGLVTCKCGNTMQVNGRNNHNKEYLSFFCPNHKNKQGCDAKEINYNQLENFVLWQLAEQIFFQKVINSFLNDFKQLDLKKEKYFKKHIRELESQILHNKNKLNNCIEVIEDGCCSEMSELLENRVIEIANENKKLAKKIKQIQSQSTIMPTMDEIMTLKCKFVSYMQSKSNLAIRKKYLREFVDKILITDDDVEIIYKI